MFEKILHNYQNIPTPAKASIWFFFSSFLQKGIAVISTPIFTRLLSTAEYGQYSAFNSWLSIITIFLSLSLYNSFYARGLAINEDDVEAFSSSLLGLTTTIVIAATIIYTITSNFWNSILLLNSSQIYLMLVIILFSSSFHYWSMRERFYFHYKKVVLVSILVALVKPILGIIFVVNSSDKVTARILATALCELITFSTCYYSIIKIGVFFRKKYWKSAMFFAIPLIPHYLSVSILNSSDKIMIRSMINSSSAGIYDLAYAIAQIMLIFNSAFNQTLDPILYKYIKNQNFGILRKIAYVSITLIAICNLLLIAFAPEVVSIFAPSPYYEAIYVIPPVSMGMFFCFFYNFFSAFEFYWNKTGYVALATTLGAILNVILNYIFIRKYGYYAAGYTTMFCYLVYVFFHYYFMKKICKEKYKECIIYNEKILIAISIMFVSLGFIFMMLYTNVVLRYLIVFIILASLFRERKMIKNTLFLFLYNKKNN